MSASQDNQICRNDEFRLRSPNVSETSWAHKGIKGGNKEDTLSFLFTHCFNISRPRCHNLLGLIWTGY